MLNKELKDEEKLCGKGKTAVVSNHCPRRNVLILLYRHTWVFVYSRSRWQTGFPLLLFFFLLFVFFSCAASSNSPVWVLASPRGVSGQVFVTQITPVVESDWRGGCSPASPAEQHHTASRPASRLYYELIYLFLFFLFFNDQPRSQAVSSPHPYSPHVLVLPLLVHLTLKCEPVVSYRHTFLHCLFGFLLPPPPSPQPHSPSFLLPPFLNSATSVLPSIYILWSTAARRKTVRERVRERKWLASLGVGTVCKLLGKLKRRESLSYTQTEKKN